MDRAWLRAVQKLEFRNPAHFLIKIRSVERQLAESDAPPKIKKLRTNPLKEWRELRDAALFCYGMGQRIGQPIYFAKGESQDYDFVASWAVGREQHFAPVQLKEVVPPELNSTATLQKTVDALTRYVDSKELTVAIHLTQQTRFEPSKLSIPPLKIAALWVFGSISPDQSAWGLWGNFLEQPEYSKFAYPA